MSANRLPTVKVKHPRPEGFAIINAADFDKNKHEIFTPEDEAASEMPDRAELDRLAQEHGVKVTPNWKDQTVWEKVQAAILAKAGAA